MTPNIEELLARAKRLRNDLDDSNARLDRQCVTAMYELEQALQSQAERITELEAQLKVSLEGWRCECSTDDACRFARERDTLRAQLAEIAATEPVAWINLSASAKMFRFLEPTEECGTVVKDWKPLFTRPMPADVTELVEALEQLARLGNGEHYGNSDGNMIARDALSKYKGAK